MKLFDVKKKEIVLDNKYSNSITIPQYKIKGDKPFIDELIDKKKTIELLNEIRNSNVSDEEKKFLTLAAYRHLVFRYDRIAEYYPHASKEMQELMEKSALIIIDIDDAIMNGYVIASNKIRNIIEYHSRGGNNEK